LATALRVLLTVTRIEGHQVRPVAGKQPYAPDAAAPPAMWPDP